MRAITRTATPTQIFVGRTVETTDGRRGVVEAAHRGRDNVINLHVRGPYGVFFDTDNEHATIVRERDTEGNV